MKTHTTAKIAVSTIVVALLVQWVAILVASPMPPILRVVFYTALLIGSALILGRVTGVEDVARMVGPGTNIRTAAKYLACFAAIGLTVQGICALFLGVISPTEAQTLRFYFFKQAPIMSNLMPLLMAPITEEIFFRGWLLGWFDKRVLSPLRLFGVEVNQAIVLSSLAFGVVHVFNIHGVFTWPKLALRIVGPFIIGIFLARCRRESGGLLIPMVCHSFCNFIANYIFVLA
ncbi:MAG: lysostaphin resistance A-like protein [Chloroflexota bacterium]